MNFISDQLRRPAMFSMVDDLFGLDGRVAIVSGASSGIGRHMAMTLAGAGADVVLVGRHEGRLEEVCDEVMSFDGGALALPADLQDAAEIARVANAASEPFGAPDILVNAAGINLREPAGDVTPESWDATLNINLKVPFFLVWNFIHYQSIYKNILEKIFSAYENNILISLMYGEKISILDF